MPKAATRQRHPVPDTATLSDLGGRLRTARTEAGLTQGQLGAPHFTRAYVSAVELGKIRPSVKSLEFMAGKLGKPLSHFVDDRAAEEAESRVRAALARAAALIAAGRAGAAVSPLEGIRHSARGSTRLDVDRSLGRAYTESGQHAKAAAVLGGALDRAVRGSDVETVMRIRAQLGAALIGTKSYAEAAAQLEQVLAAFASAQAKDPFVKLQALHHLGACFYARGEFRTALSYFERALLEGEDVGDPRFLGSTYAATGMSRYQTGDFEGAISCFLKSEAVFESVDNDDRVTNTRFQIAIALRGMGNRAKALDVARQAAARATASGNAALSVRIRTFAAVCQAELGERDSAVSVLASLVDEADRTKEASVRFVARFGLARIVKDTDVAHAERLLREAVALVETSELRSDLADAYSELSDVLSRRGMAEAALQYANKALKLAKEI